jgi:hypothetical protein
MPEIMQRYTVSHIEYAEQYLNLHKAIIAAMLNSRITER